MEVINGDYGDIVPKLVQAVLSGECDAFNDRYKICLPKRISFLSSRNSKSNKSRDSTSNISSTSSHPSANGSIMNGSIHSNGDSSMLIDSAEGSSKESSEEVSSTLLLSLTSLYHSYWSEVTQRFPSSRYWPGDVRSVLVCLQEFQRCRILAMFCLVCLVISQCCDSTSCGIPYMVDSSSY